MNDTPKCSEEARQRLKMAVSELTKACPLGTKNPMMCPLNPVRKRRPSTRANWIESLKDEDLEFLVSYHAVCQKWQKAGCP
jgi:dihydroorotase-like cyclic amidohydrolase